MRVRRKKLESKGWRWEREWANKNERQGLNDGSLGSMVSSDEVYEGLGILLEFWQEYQID